MADTPEELLAAVHENASSTGIEIVPIGLLPWEERATSPRIIVVVPSDDSELSADEINTALIDLNHRHFSHDIRTSEEHYGSSFVSLGMASATESLADEYEEHTTRRVVVHRQEEIDERGIQVSQVGSRRISDEQPDHSYEAKTVLIFLPHRRLLGVVQRFLEFYNQFASDKDGIWEAMHSSTQSGQFPIGAMDIRRMIDDYNPEVPKVLLDRLHLPAAHPDSVEHMTRQALDAAHAQYLLHSAATGISERERSDLYHWYFRGIPPEDRLAEIKGYLRDKQK